MVQPSPRSAARTASAVCAQHCTTVARRRAARASVAVRSSGASRPVLTSTFSSAASAAALHSAAAHPTSERRRAGRAQRSGSSSATCSQCSSMASGARHAVRRVREPGGARGVVLRDGVGPLQRQKARRVRVNEREQRRALRVAAGGQRGERVVPVGVAGVGCRHVRGHRGQARRQRPGECGRAPPPGAGCAEASCAVNSERSARS